MQNQIISAILTDEAGEILLVRRRNSALWTLPGGEVRGPVSSVAFLTTCCRRQVGLAPDFVAPLQPIAFAGKRALVGVDEVRRERARACGRVEVTGWFPMNALPLELAPLARMAIRLCPRPAPAAPVASTCRLALAS